MIPDEFDFEPLEEEALKNAVAEGCNLSVRAESDMIHETTRFYTHVDGSFFMAIAGLAKLMEKVSKNAAAEFEERKITANDDGSPTAWEHVAETLLVSVAAYLGFDIRVVGRCDLEEEARAEAEEFSKYREI